MTEDGKILISVDEVERTAESIRSLNGMLCDQLAEMKHRVEALAGSWQSEAGDALQSRFRQFSQRFDDYERVVEAYAAFLERTAMSYREAEALMKKVL